MGAAGASAALALGLPQAPVPHAAMTRTRRAPMLLQVGRYLSTGAEGASLYLKVGAWLSGSTVGRSTVGSKRTSAGRVCTIGNT